MEGGRAAQSLKWQRPQTVAAAVKRPGVERVEARLLSPAEVRAWLDAASGSRYHPLLVLLSATGVRRGEALALRWEDLDLDGGLLWVRMIAAKKEMLWWGFRPSRPATELRRLEEARQACRRPTTPVRF